MRSSRALRVANHLACDCAIIMHSTGRANLFIRILPFFYENVAQLRGSIFSDLLRWLCMRKYRPIMLFVPYIPFFRIYYVCKGWVNFYSPL